MKCRHIDELLCEYLDGALPIEQQREFEQHLAECSACTETVAESEFALGFVREVPAAEPPPELIADIIHDTIGVRGTMPVLAPAGGGGDAPGSLGWLRPIFNPFLQPRFAMSMVMAVLSLSMLTFYAKGALENWQPGKSKPVAVVEHIGDQFARAWEATTEFFETVRGMYQLQREFATEPEGNLQQAPPQVEQQSEPQAAPQAEPEAESSGGAQAPAPVPPAAPSEQPAAAEPGR
jgi:hypothetical protein